VSREGKRQMAKGKRQTPRCASGE